MGTSVSQSSPKTGGWRAVSSCYTASNASAERTATEVWRAASHQDNSVFEQLGTGAVAECLKAAQGRLNKDAAADKIVQIGNLKQNTVVGEFAKRALMIKAAGGYEGETAASVLFRQLTDYFISRDVSGYVGPAYRCKTIAELRALKEQVGDAVARKVRAAERSENLGSKSWSEAYPVLLKKLQQS